MTRHVAKELKLGSYEAIEGFLKDAKSFKLSPVNQTVEDFYVIEGDIIFLDKDEEPIGFSRGNRMNDMLNIWIVKQYQVNGEYSSVQVSISEKIVYDAWSSHLTMVDHATFVE